MDEKLKSGEREEEIGRLLCERILNESWSRVEQFTYEIEKIVKRGTIEKKEDLSLLLAATDCFLQKVHLTNTSNEFLGLSFGVPCGRNYKSCDMCELEECDYFSGKE